MEFFNSTKDAYEMMILPFIAQSMKALEELDEGNVMEKLIVGVNSLLTFLLQHTIQEDHKIILETFVEHLEKLGIILRFDTNILKHMEN